MLEHLNVTIKTVVIKFDVLSNFSPSGLQVVIYLDTKTSKDVCDSHVDFGHRYVFQRQYVF